jgi:hypothetical protein
MHRNQHLLVSPADVPAAAEARPSQPSRSPEPKKMGTKIVMAATIALFNVAHGFGLHAMHATGLSDVSPEMLATYGD